MGSPGSFRANIGSEKSGRVIQGSLAACCCLKEKPLLPRGSLTLRGLLDLNSLVLLQGTNLPPNIK